MGQDNRPVRYIERDEDGNETVVYRASGGLTWCDRAIVALANGVPGAAPPEWLQMVFTEGVLAEGDIAAMHEEQTGLTLVNDQLEVELEMGEINGRRVIIRGHIDGEAETPEGLIGREFKKLRPSMWDEFVRKGVEIRPEYPWQVSVYWYARNWVECEFVGGKLIGYQCDKDTNRIHDKPNGPDDDGSECVPECKLRMPVIGELHTTRLTAPPIPLKAIRKRVVHLERLIAEGRAPLDVECSRHMYPCPYFALHDEDEAGVFELPTNDETVAAVTLLTEIEQQRKKLNAEVRKLDDKRKEVSKKLREIIAGLGPEADEAKELVLRVKDGEELRLIRKRYVQPERVQRSYTVDTFSIPTRKKAKEN